MKKKQGVHTPSRPLRKMKMPANHVIACQGCPAWVPSQEVRFVDKKEHGNNIVSYVCPICGTDMIGYAIPVEKYLTEHVNVNSRFPFGAGWKKHPIAYIKRTNF